MMKRHAMGFTLLELLVTIAVAAILLTLALPSYRHTVESNAVATRVNDLVGALNYARSAAVSRGTDVYLCASTDESTCSDQDPTDWARGWLVYLPVNAAQTTSVGQTLRVQGGTAPGVALVSDSGQPVRFNSNGFAMSGRHFSAGASSSDLDTRICIAATGRVRSAHGSQCS